MRIALAQMPIQLDSWQKNIDQIEASIQAALCLNAELIIFPELSLQGYIPRDYLYQSDYQVMAQNMLEACRKRTRHYPIYVIFGSIAVQPNSSRLYNAAHLMFKGEILHTHHKQHLPSHGVFDEHRYFSTQVKSATVSSCYILPNGQRIGMAICEDIWHTPVQQTEDLDILCVLNASPFDYTKHPQRLEKAAQALSYAKHVAYVNWTGSVDECLFDGQSFVMRHDHKILLQAPAFAQGVYVVDTAISSSIYNTMWQAQTQKPSPEQVLALAEMMPTCVAGIVQGIRDYVKSSGATGVVLGLSGGIDSAVVASLAVQALGAKNVHTVMMPTKYTADISHMDAHTMAQNFGVGYDICPIQALVTEYADQLMPHLGEIKSITHQNIQARIRGQILMAYSNQKNALLLTTGNKSELAMGYCTLYGDMAGGFAPLKDVYKTQVYALARYINAQAEKKGQIAPPIPWRVIERPPSAELADNQKDEDSLGSYAVLDRILYAYIEEKCSLEKLAQTFGADTVMPIIKKLHQNEYKRQQSAIGPKISPCAFGLDWRYPVMQTITQDVHTYFSAISSCS